MASLAAEGQGGRTSTEKDAATTGAGCEFSTELSLEEIRKMQAQFVSERGWEKYHTPRNLVLAMVGEVGELSEIFQWRGEVEPGLPADPSGKRLGWEEVDSTNLTQFISPIRVVGWSDEDKEHLGQEISDVLIYLIRLADRCNIDLPTAVLSKIKLNSVKYPISQVYGSSKKYSAYRPSGTDQTKEE